MGRDWKSFSMYWLVLVHRYYTYACACLAIIAMQLNEFETARPLLHDDVCSESNNRKYMITVYYFPFHLNLNRNACRSSTLSEKSFLFCCCWCCRSARWRLRRCRQCCCFAVTSTKLLTLPEIFFFFILANESAVVSHWCVSVCLLEFWEKHSTRWRLNII